MRTASLRVFVTRILGLGLIAFALVVSIQISFGPQLSPFESDIAAQNSPAIASGPPTEANFESAPERVPILSAVPDASTANARFARVSTGRPLPAGLAAAMSKTMEEAAYEITQKRGNYRASNRAQGMRIAFSQEGITVAPHGRAGGLKMELTGIGYGSHMQAVNDAELTASGKRIDYHRATSSGTVFTEWYINTAKGLEQGFTLPTRPSKMRAERDPLVFEFTLAGDLKCSVTSDGSAMSCATAAGNVALRYSELYAFDARGRELPCKLGMRRGRLALSVDDSDAMYPLTVDPLVTTQQAKLTAGDEVGGGNFGKSVALSDDGNTALVGVPRNDVGGANSGAAYIFVRSGTSWGQQTKLTAADADGEARFGISVALSDDGNTALIGAYVDGDPGYLHSGSAYVFVRSGTSWSQQGKLTASDHLPDDNLGISVALSGNGDRALVGAYLDDAPGLFQSGSAYVFDRVNGAWPPQLQKLTALTEASQARFGVSVALSEDGNTALVGALEADPLQPGSGSAYVFVYDGGWSVPKQLTAGILGAAGDKFGSSVALSDDGKTAVIGAPFHDGLFSDSGSAYVFESLNSIWGLPLELTAGIDSDAGDQFGVSVALSGDADTVLVGANFEGSPVHSGSAYVFVRSGMSWNPQDKLIAADAAADDQFGGAVALNGNGDTALVGAWIADNALVDSGSAYVFLRAIAVWSQQAKLTAGDEVGGGNFGKSVALSDDGNTALVGVPRNDVGGANSGAAYIFVRSGTSWGQQTKLTAADADGEARFGISVALSDDGNTALIGAYVDGDPGYLHSGSAYVFVRSGTSWSQQGKLTASDHLPDDNLGISVALSGNGDRALVGAYLDDAPGLFQSGSAYVFDRVNGAWPPQLQKLTALTEASQARFGVSVALSEDGNTALVGALEADPLQPGSGSAYVFVYDGGWSVPKQLTAGILGAAGDKFGSSVALSDDGKTAVIGAPFHDGLFSDSGSAYVFESLNSIWGLPLELTAGIDSDAGDQFGVSVALSGDADTVLVGANFEGSPVHSGSAYVFVRSNSDWWAPDKLTAADAAADDQFGGAVALNGNGDTALVGAWIADNALVDSGSAYVFNLNRDPVALILQLSGDVLALNLDDKTEKKLLDDLAKANQEIDKSKNKNAIDQLEKFIKEVGKSEGKMEIFPAAAAALIAAAQAIIDRLAA